MANGNRQVSGKRTIIAPIRNNATGRIITEKFIIKTTIVDNFRVFIPALLFTIGKVLMLCPILPYASAGTPACYVRLKKVLVPLFRSQNVDEDLREVDVLKFSCFGKERRHL